MFAWFCVIDFIALLVVYVSVLLAKLMCFPFCVNSSGFLAAPECSPRARCGFFEKYGWLFLAWVVSCVRFVVTYACTYIYIYM